MYDDNANGREVREQRLRWALLLRSWGHIPLPLAPQTKRPIVDNWPAFPMPTEAMLRSWILERGLNYGVLCGERSNNLVIVDFDNIEAYRAWCRNAPLIETLTVESARGVHLYVSLDELPAHKAKMAQNAGDILTTGAFIVAPYSIHPSGALYRVRRPEHAIRRFESLDVLELPLERKISQKTYAPRGREDVALGGAPSMARIAGVVAAFASAVEGTRNAMLLWSACRCFDEGMSAAEVEETLIPVALSLGLLEREALATIASAEKQERRSPAAHALRPSRRRLSPRERQQQRRRGR